MKPKNIAAALAIVALGNFAPNMGRAQDIDAMPPVVVKSFPEAGAKDVTPGVVEIKATFSKEMTDQSWSWANAWQGSAPEIVEKPKYLDDNKTCVIKVKLEPNTTYGWWLNSQNFHGFKDKQGHSAVPYLLTFQTSAG